MRLAKAARGFGGPEPTVNRADGPAPFPSEVIYRANSIARDSLITVTRI